jgi:hypothetical protein
MLKRYILFAFSIFCFCQSEAAIDSIAVPQEITFKDIDDRIAILSKENAILKAQLEMFISENEKKLSLVTWPLGLVVGLLLTIYGFGAIRSYNVAKQEARKAFEEDFEKLKARIETVKTEAEKQLAEITTIRDLVSERGQQ